MTDCLYVYMEEKTRDTKHGVLVSRYKDLHTALSRTCSSNGRMGQYFLVVTLNSLSYHYIFTPVREYHLIFLL